MFLQNKSQMEGFPIQAVTLPVWLRVPLLQAMPYAHNCAAFII